MYDYNYTLGWVLWKKEDALSIQGVVLQIAEESLTVKVIFKPKDEKIALCEEAFGKCWRERKCQGQNLCAKRAMCVQGIRENQCIWSLLSKARSNLTWGQKGKKGPDIHITPGTDEKWSKDLGHFWLFLLLTESSIWNIDFYANVQWDSPHSRIYWKLYIRESFYICTRERKLLLNISYFIIFFFLLWLYIAFVIEYSVCNSDEKDIPTMVSA